jgi:outer membrane protein TolC
MKKLLCIAFAALLAIIPLQNAIKVYAADGTKTISIYDAFNIFNTTDKQLNLYNQQIKLLQNNIDKYNKSYAGGITASSGSNSFSTYTDYVSQTNSLDNLKHTTDKYVRDQKRVIETTYLNGCNTQSDIDNLKLSLESINKQIAISNEKLTLGQIKQSDIDPLNLQKQQIEAQISSAQNSLSTVLNSLKVDLGIDLNQDISLISYSKAYSKFDDSNIDSKIDEAAKKCYDAIIKKQNLDLSNVTYKNASTDLFTDSQTLTNTLIQDKVAIMQNQLLYDQAIDLSKKSIWEEYYTLKSDEANVEIEQYNTKIQQTKYDLLLAQQKVNKTTDSDVFAQNVNVVTQNVKLQDAINTYMVEVDRFNDLLTNP